MPDNNADINENGAISTEMPRKLVQNLAPADAAHILNAGNIVTACNVQFTGAIDTENLEKPLDEGDICEQKENIAALNPDKALADLFIMKRWDISEFERSHLPVIIGKINDASGFSAQKALRLLDMAIYMPGQGWAIPVELSQFQETIEMAVKHERLLNPEINDYYVYITVDQKRVPPAKTQRRPGYHSDAYETSETDDDLTNKNADNTYIIYDAIPTHFQAGPFPLNGNVDPEDCDAVLKYFDRLSEGKPAVHFPNHTMVKLTPYDVHSPALNESGDFVDRTFVKITFSKKPYNLLGNYINNTPDKNGRTILDYTGWDWVPRDPTARNHRNKVRGWPR